MREELRKVLRDSEGIHFHLRRRFLLVFGATFVVALVGALGIYFFERHGNGTEIHTYGDALFWTSGQLLTVSSQLKNPVTTGGRILDIFFEAWAISAVAALAGTIGNFFVQKHHQEQRRQRPSTGDLINRPLP
jgi:hypothetical protein